MNLDLGMRQHKRVLPDGDQPVGVDINGENFVEILTAKDISVGGLSISVPHMFQGCDINTPVSVIVTLPAPVNKTFQVGGMIKHISNSLYGIEFTGLEDCWRKEIKKYISSRRSNESWTSRLLSP
jgi:hypothetical protein